MKQLQVEYGTFTFLTDEVFVPLAVDVRPVSSVLGLLRDDHTVLQGQVVWLWRTPVWDQYFCLTFV